MPTQKRPRRLSYLALLSTLALSACGGNRDRAHMDAMAREHAGDSPIANASRLPPAQDVTARRVVYGSVNGRELTGYLVRPLRAGDGAIPGVVVVHEWWGLNDNVEMMARRLAGEGYAVLAVDMYGGKVARTPAEAQLLMKSVAEAPADGTANLEAAAAYLSDQERAPKVGILGWCFGGGWSLRGALAMPTRIDAAVMYYGQPITDRTQLAALEAPLLGHFGGEDHSIPESTVREMESTLTSLGKKVEVYVYPGAAHAFANPSGTSYQPEAAERAWERTTAFLATNLREPAR